MDRFQHKKPRVPCMRSDLQPAPYHFCSHFTKNPCLNVFLNINMGYSTPNCGYICSHDPNGHILTKKTTGALYRERSTTGAAPILLRFHQKSMLKFFLKKYGLFNPKLWLHMLTRSQWTHSTKKTHGCPI